MGMIGAPDPTTSPRGGSVQGNQVPGLVDKQLLPQSAVNGVHLCGCQLPGAAQDWKTKYGRLRAAAGGLDYIKGGSEGAPGLTSAS